MSTTLSRSGRIALATCLLWGVSGTPAFAQQAPPAPTDEQRAGALIRPAVVYLEISETGVVRNANGLDVLRIEAGEADSTCTGFVVNPNGYIATAAHCVDIGPESTTLESVILQAVEAEIAAGSTLSADVLLDLATAGFTYGGVTPGTPVERTVKVYTGSGAGTGMLGRSETATVVDIVPFSKGDVALLKISATNLPSTELASDADVRQGVRVLSIGYPGNRGAVIDTTIEPTFKDGQVSSRSTSDGKPIYEVSAAASGGQSGGPTIITDGRVIGVNSFAPTVDRGGFTFVAPAATLNDMLVKNNIKAELGPLDRTYRAGLTQFYAGEYTDAIGSFDQVLASAPDHRSAQDLKADAVRLRTQFGDAGIPTFWLAIGGATIVLLVLVVGAVVLLRRRRPTPAPAYPFGAPYPPYGPSYGPPPPWGAPAVPSQRPPPWAPQHHGQAAAPQEAATTQLTPPQRTAPPELNRPPGEPVTAPPITAPPLPPGQSPEATQPEPETKALVWPPPPQA